MTSQCHKDPLPNKDRKEYAMGGSREGFLEEMTLQLSLQKQTEVSQKMRRARNYSQGHEQRPRGMKTEIP